MQLLVDLLQREDFTASDAVEVASALYALSLQGTPEQQEAVQILLALAQRRDIPFSDTVETTFRTCRRRSRFFFKQKRY